MDGALEMECVAQDGERAEFTEEAWKKAYQVMEQMFPRRSVLGWFLCGAPGSALSPLNYWKQHGQYFSEKNQIMYLNCGLEGEEAVYTASSDGFYKLRGYCIYYERNQMMQDYMVSRRDAHRVESGGRDAVIRDFRERMEGRKAEAGRKRSAVSVLGTPLKNLEAVLASVRPEKILGADEDEPIVERIAGEVYPTPAESEIVIAQPESPSPAAQGGNAGAQSDEQSPVMGEKDGAEQPAALDLPEEASPMKEAEPVQIPADAVLHVVENGETLYGICMERYQSVAPIEEICRWNRLEDENHIFIGQKRYLPPV